MNYMIKLPGLQICILYTCSPGSLIIKANGLTLYHVATTQGILHLVSGGIRIFQDIPDNTYILQDVDQELLSEFQSSPGVAYMATTSTWLPGHR